MKKFFLLPVLLLGLSFGSCTQETETLEEQEFNLDLSDISFAIDLGEDFFVSTYNLEEDNLDELINDLTTELYDFSEEDIQKEGYIGFDLVIKGTQITIKPIAGTMTAEEVKSGKDWSQLGVYSVSNNLASKIQEVINTEDNNINIQVKRNTKNASLFLG
ncbi:hypothetical protein SAMN04488096_105317 [Mesonia phycicola]|uniref:Uncharacterized protein n=1 Tax=Mesonia phycicola TaxID=579105 RepID=A0A1M6EXS4_9FLAO|nr:hypothetical protein [Mesonia phycicola]SHI90189.1 hypothetical protein SAMN04488096_105317 [Mesonia phycicola]